MKEVAEVLSAAGLRWWIDSGTLLALVREGKLFDADKDIDLGCWAGQEQHLASAVSSLQAKGYRVGRRRFQSRVCKYWIRPPLFSKLRSIDLKLYTRHGDLAICPVTHSRSRRHKGTLGWLASEAVRVPLAVLWRRRFARSWRLPVLGVEFTIMTWAIPAKFVDLLEPRTFDDVPLSVPTPIDEYLSFRYGDWRMPVTDWVPHRDDGGLVLGSPEAVLTANRPRSDQ